MLKREKTRTRSQAEQVTCILEPGRGGHVYPGARQRGSRVSWSQAERVTCILERDSTEF